VSQAQERCLSRAKGQLEGPQLVRAPTRQWVKAPARRRVETAPGQTSPQRPTRVSRRY
jgi:hypothetical protein